MVNPNKRVKRPNGLGELFKYQTDDDEKIYPLLVNQLIKNNYIYLLRAIKKENFFIRENETCLFFKEIVYDNEVVGFSTYRSSNLDKDSLVMQHIYILPEFRGKHLLQEELDEATLLFETNIIIESPNRYIINSLIKHKLARIFDDRIVISRIPFMVPLVEIDEVKKGTFLEDYDITKTNGLSKVSLVYDLDLCAVVGLAKKDADTSDDNNIDNISLALKVDNEDFDCTSKRAEDKWLQNNEYFDNVRKIVDSNEEVIQNWLTIY